jgi:hypothetical protein
MITAKVLLTQPLKAERQFAATTVSEHHMLLDDAAGGTQAHRAGRSRIGRMHSI